MRKSIYFLTTTPSSHTHRLRKVKSMDDNCGEWVECMGVASGCGEQEAGVASGSGWNLATGCGCKEVYRSFYLSLLLCSFLQQHPYFLFIF